MYRKVYGLARHPFEKDLEPDKLFGSQAANELEARLGYLLQLRGIGLAHVCPIRYASPLTSQETVAEDLQFMWFLSFFSTSRIFTH